MDNIEKYLVFKNEKEKKDIIQYLNEKKLFIDDLTMESMINVVSAAKNNLNEELSELANYKSDFFQNRIYASIINAKNQKINNLINMYNQSNSYNKINFKNNIINFNNITTIDNIKLEIDNFNYDIPINFELIFYCYDGEIIKKNIIPFNYSGIYSEYVDLSDPNPQSIFSVANKNNLYFYSCNYSDKGFSLGTEVFLSKNKDYSFDSNGRIIFDKNKMEHKQIIVKYQPNENAYEINHLLKRLYKIELIINNDKMDINENLNKRLVLFNE